MADQQERLLKCAPIAASSMGLNFHRWNLSGFESPLAYGSGSNLYAPTMKAAKNSLLRTGFLIHDVSRMRRTVYDQRLKGLGVTRSQWWVLANLSRHNGQGFMQVELAKLLDVGKVTLGGLIDRLEKTGLVVRQPDLMDRRSKRVVISAKGLKLTTKLEAISKMVNAEIMAGITEKEEETLIRLLAKMKHNLIAMEGMPAVVPARKPRRTVEVRS